MGEETKRPLNHCLACGNTWYPKGRDESNECPKCKNKWSVATEHNLAQRRVERREAARRAKIVSNIGCLLLVVLVATFWLYGRDEHDKGQDEQAPQPPPTQAPIIPDSNSVPTETPKDATTQQEPLVPDRPAESCPACDGSGRVAGPSDSELQDRARQHATELAEGASAIDDTMTEERKKSVFEAAYDSKLRTLKEERERNSKCARCAGTGRVGG